MKKIILTIILLSVFLNATSKTIFEGYSGMGLELNKKISKKATVSFFLKPVEDLEYRGFLKNILSKYNVKTDNLLCLMDGDLVCIKKDKQEIVNGMIVIKVHGGAMNPDQPKDLISNRDKIINNLGKKYKTSFNCSRLSPKEIQKRLLNPNGSFPVVVSSCESKSITPSIKVYIDLDGGGGDIVSFYNF